MDWKRDLFVVIPFGGDYQAAEVIRGSERAIAYAQGCVLQHITDHKELPFKVSEAVRQEIGVHVFRVAEELDLPIQEWADNLYQEIREDRKKDEEREHQLYLKLKAKYEGK